MYTARTWWWLQLIGCVESILIVWILVQLIVIPKETVIILMRCKTWFKYRIGSYFCRFKFLWFGKLRQFCGFIISWHILNFGKIRRPTKTTKIWIPPKLPTMRCICVNVSAKTNIVCTKSEKRYNYCPNLYSLCQLVCFSGNFFSTF